MSALRRGIVAGMAFGAVALASLATAQGTRSMPLPPGEARLTTVTARPWHRVSKADAILEGPSFERSGDLIFSDNTARRVMRITPDGKLSVVATFEDAGPGGIAIHRDGRIFVALNTPDYKRGWIVAMRPDGSDRQVVLAPERGLLPNDIVFTADGGFYVTDFKGSATRADGGVYHVSADHRTVKSVVTGIARANGVALSPDGHILWVVEHGRNQLHRIELADATTPTPLGTTIPYHFTGPAPDSMRVDADGQVYVALMGQGRVLVLSPDGIPIGQILVPKRDARHDLATSNLALRPGRHELLLVAGNKTGEHGATLYEAKAFGPGLTLFSHAGGPQEAH